MVGLRFALVLMSLGVFAVPAFADRRVALVVGNGAYTHADKLANPVTDARRMRDALAKLGFETIYGEDLDLRSLQRTVGRFAKTVDGADVALVFYAGHGSTFGDVPYVVPIDADYASLEDVPYEMLPLETLIGELRRAKGVRVAIVDACRDNAAERILKREAMRGGTVSRGLAPVKNPAGLIIAYATQYLDTAADGPPGGDSPFTAALLNDIATPGLDIKDLLFKVAREVVTATNGRQRPEISVSLYDPYQLGGPAPAEPPGPSPDALTWSLLKSTTDAQIVAAFLARLPADSPLRAEVAARLAAMRAVASGVSTEPIPAGRTPASGEGPAANASPSPAVSPLTAYRAAMLVESASVPGGSETYTGTVTWRIESGPAGPGSGASPKVRADIDLPSAALTASMILEKNSDASLPASQVVTLRIALGAGSKVAAAKEMAPVQLRREAAPTGDALRGVIVRITDNFFLAGLSSADEDVTRNSDLLRTRGWFDLPLKLADGKVAKLTFEKGAVGTKVVDDALASWRQAEAAHR